MLSVFLVADVCSFQRRCNTLKQIIMRLKIALFFSLGVFATPVASVAQTHTASSLFNAMEKLVYQIRVIDNASDDKTTIGSGFRAGQSGLVATNYHVISLAALEPEKYRITLVASDGAETKAEIVNADVLHDLAILRPARSLDTFIPIATEEPTKGARIFSIGNPLDLGMSIVEGNFNGLVKTSRFRRFLFSGSLNPGMSGGPAFNHRGELIGINVATGGEQISFLVPAARLARLLNSAQDLTEENLLTRIERDLFAEQETFYQGLLDDEWQVAEFGGLMLPQELNSSMKCWGHNVDDEDAEYQAFHQHCQSEEYIYIKDSFYTGNFSYDYEWLTTDRLNPLQFYTAVQNRFTHQSAGNAYQQEDVTEFSCETGFVDIANSNWKVSTCLRRYKEFQSIYDATLLLVSLSKKRSAAVIKMGVTGSSKDHATDIFEKLIRSISWAN